MTSEARKQAWLGNIRPPQPDDGLQNWAYIWRFRRKRDRDHEYCLCLLTDTRTFNVYIIRRDRPIGQMNASNHHLAGILRTQLTQQQLAVGLAAILTRNHAQGT